MADILTPEQRSERMRRIRSKDTGPELAIRRIVRSLGVGYRLHRRDLPGTPDLAFIGRRKAIFVHGCFWHGHEGEACVLARMPKSRVEFWRCKIATNRERDARKIRNLEDAGWTVLVAWECQLRDTVRQRRLIAEFLGVPHVD